MKGREREEAREGGKELRKEGVMGGVSEGEGGEE